MGAVIEAVTQQGVQCLLNAVLRQPLGLRYFSYGLPEALEQEQTTEYLTGGRPNLFLQKWIERLLGTSLEQVISVVQDERFRAQPIPAVNLFATTWEMCQFMQLLLFHGTYGSKTIFSPQAISRALKPADNWRLDKQFMLPMRYSAGFMLGANPVGLWGPFSQRSFGHLGFTNKWCWANPQSQTAVCLTSNGNCIASAPLKAMIPFVVEVQKLVGVF